MADTEPGWHFRLSLNLVGPCPAGCGARGEPDTAAVYLSLWPPGTSTATLWGTTLAWTCTTPTPSAPTAPWSLGWCWPLSLGCTSRTTPSLGPMRALGCASRTTCSSHPQAARWVGGAQRVGGAQARAGDGLCVWGWQLREPLGHVRQLEVAAVHSTQNSVSCTQGDRPPYCCLTWPLTGCVACACVAVCR